METPNTNTILNDQTVTSAPAPTSPASADAQAASRVRDATGRFASAAAPTPPDGQTATPQAPVVPPPKFSPELNSLAREAFYTDDEINQFHSPSALFEAVQGRHAMMLAQRAAQQVQGGNGQYQQPQQAPPQQQSAQPMALADLALKLDEDTYSEELAKPLKEVAAYVNQLKGTLVQQLAQRDQRIAQLEGHIQQSAVASNQVAQSQVVQMADQVASSVPGLVEAIGRPSQHLHPQSPNYAAWSEFAGVVHTRRMAQGVPDEFIDAGRAWNEAWIMYRALKGNGTNGQNNGNAGLPGMAPRSAPRHTAAPNVNRDMTRDEDFKYRLANIEAMFAANGGMNPLRS